METKPYSPSGVTTSNDAKARQCEDDRATCSTTTTAINPIVCTSRSVADPSLLIGSTKSTHLDTVKSPFPQTLTYQSSILSSQALKYTIRKQGPTVLGNDECKNQYKTSTYPFLLRETESHHLHTLQGTFPQKNLISQNSVLCRPLSPTRMQETTDTCRNIHSTNEIPGIKPMSTSHTLSPQDIESKSISTTVPSRNFISSPKGSGENSSVVYVTELQRRQRNCDMRRWNGERHHRCCSTGAVLYRRRIMNAEMNAQLSPPDLDYHPDNHVSTHSGTTPPA